MPLKIKHESKLPALRIPHFQFCQWCRRRRRRRRDDELLLAAVVVVVGGGGRVTKTRELEQYFIVSRRDIHRKREVAETREGPVDHQGRFPHYSA